MIAAAGALGLLAVGLCACTAGGGNAAGSSAGGPPAGTEQEWADLKQEIRRRFPQVRQLSTADYVRSRGAATEALLADVRPEAEYQVGWIPGALHAPAGEGFLDAFAGVPKDRLIVLYCSVGWRSSAAAVELMAAGFSRVSNLEGSVFEWANAGHPLVDAAGPVRRVHPYDGRWGRLLAPALRAPLPAEQR